MKVAVEEIGACKRRLQVEEGPEVVQDAWEKAFKRVQKEARLPGFRKGKVPAGMIKLHFADDVRQEVARHLIPDVYRQALQETRLRPVEEPDLKEVTLEEGAPLKFEAMVEIKREIGDFVGSRPPTAQEVATSKNGSTLTLPGRWETARAVARDIAALVRFQLPDDYWSRYAELVSRLTVRDVDAAAKRLLTPDRLTWVVVGDRAAIEAKVRALGFGEIAIIDADGKPVATR